MNVVCDLLVVCFANMSHREIPQSAAGCPKDISQHLSKEALQLAIDSGKMSLIEQSNLLFFPSLFQSVKESSI